jgi:hypothetical protein
MTTVTEVDRLVTADDAVAARVWPHLGPRAREAYLGDRNAWIVLRQGAGASGKPAATVLAHHHQVFAGWARAFRAAGRSAPRRHPLTAPPAATIAKPSTQTARTPSPASAPSYMATGTKAAIAGGLLLVGAVALAGRRKRA